jgi:hypothetical protein
VYVDSLTATMFLMVTFIATLIHLACLPRGPAPRRKSRKSGYGPRCWAA